MLTSSVICCAGVALDDLVYICTKIARQMDSDGLSKVFDAAETATSAIQEARPLLENAVKLVDEVCPESVWHAQENCWHLPECNMYLYVAQTSCWCAI